MTGDVVECDPEFRRQILAQADAVLGAIREAGRDALRMHKRMGLPIVSWQDGRVVLIPPEQIVLDD